MKEFEKITPLWLHPVLWGSDAIGWFVSGEGVYEFAPNECSKDFLTFWPPPVDAETGAPLNWRRLPVRYSRSRFPAFGKTLGWLPSPFEEFAPLRSIVTNATQTVRREPMKGMNRWVRPNDASRLSASRPSKLRPTRRGQS